MMALFINILILLKASHLEMKISGALECCQTQGRTSKLFVGWWGGSRLRQFSQHLKHAQNFLPLSPDCLFLLNFVPSSDSWADLLSKEFWVPQTCLERGFQVQQVTAVLLTLQQLNCIIDLKTESVITPIGQQFSYYKVRTHFPDLQHQ